MFIVQFSTGTMYHIYKNTFILYNTEGLKRVNENLSVERSALEYGRRSFEQKVSWISPFKLEIITE